ncbi:NADH-quinone oxidoreductase subunit NuoE [Desulfosporosinus sp. OT]|uniref:NADH-quinone oxidoreductase subunit NuoE n=1 Tax=Desulfosporosinus sp. OT TaxID=913865 RepID=UPI000223A70A|nr:putative NAD-reducing hydrogenase subunit domain protein [Desulfosporosinus sp. OT]
MSCDCEKKLEAEFSTNKVDTSLMDEVIDKFKRENGNLISVLQDAQEAYGYLPLDVLKMIADRTGNKRAKIYGVATFYSQFRLKPRGKYIILTCQGTACHVNGSDAIAEALCEELNIKVGDSTSDWMFSLEEVACLGCCSLAPVIMINGEAFGNLTPKSARKIVKDIYASEKGVAVNED